MSLSLSKQTGTFEFIAFQDSSVTCDRETYEKYLDSLDESLLGLTDEKPTRFVIKKTLGLKEATEVKKAMASIKGKNIDINISYMILDLKYSIADIKNASDSSLSFKKCSQSNGCADDLAVMLDTAGIGADILRARNSATNLTKANSVPKQKS